MYESAFRRPPPALRRHVASYSGYRQSGNAPGQHRGLPSPYLTLIVTLDEPLLLAEHRGGSPTRRYDALVGGLHTTPAHVVHPGRQAGIQLGLTPLGARALLGVPAGALAGIDVHVSDLLGPSVVTLREQLMAVDSWGQRFAVLDRWLAAVVDQDAELAPELAQAWRMLTASGGARPVAEIADEVGWSDRHLRARLRAETGLTPKTAARVARFDRARHRLLRRVEEGGTASLSELAASGGYSDQAHLAREFRDLAGCSPSVWVVEEFRNVQATDAALLAGSPHER